MRAPVAIVAALIRDRGGRVLLVHKVGKREPGEDDLVTRAFMQPGGNALAREINEELGCRMDRRSAMGLGHFRAPAANESDRDVAADMYAVSIEGEARASAEIAEVLWIDPRRPPSVELAPLTRDFILPLVAGGRFAP